MNSKDKDVHSLLKDLSAQLEGYVNEMDDIREDIDAWTNCLKSDVEALLKGNRISPVVPTTPGAIRRKKKKTTKRHLSIIRESEYDREPKANYKGAENVTSHEYATSIDISGERILDNNQSGIYEDVPDNAAVLSKYDGVSKKLSFAVRRSSKRKSGSLNVRPVRVTRSTRSLMKHNVQDLNIERSRMQDKEITASPEASLSGEVPYNSPKPTNLSSFSKEKSLEMEHNSSKKYESTFISVMQETRNRISIKEQPEVKKQRQDTKDVVTPHNSVSNEITNSSKSPKVSIVAKKTSIEREHGIKRSYVKIYRNVESPSLKENNVTEINKEKCDVDKSKGYVSSPVISNEKSLQTYNLMSCGMSASPELKNGDKRRLEVTDVIPSKRSRLNGNIEGAGEREDEESCRNSENICRSVRKSKMDYNSCKTRSEEISNKLTQYNSFVGGESSELKNLDKSNNAISDVRCQENPQKSIDQDTMELSQDDRKSSSFYSMDKLEVEETCSDKNVTYFTASPSHETNTLRRSSRNLRTEAGELFSNKCVSQNAEQNISSNKITKSPCKGVKSPYLFSPYANETVKNRVAAYETLSVMIGPDIMKTNKRVTRSKARAMIVRKSDLIKNLSQMNNSKGISSTQKHARTSVNKAIKLLVGRKDDSSKENSLLYSTKKAPPLVGSKILSDVNVLSTSQSQRNISRKTPLTGPRVLLTNICSTGLINKSTHKLGVSVCDTFIKKAPKPNNAERKKLEELKKREEKEREAQRRKEEILKKRAEEQRKKEEKRLRVIQNREAQEKEKKECQLRVGRERDEKLIVLLHEREVKQKGQALKKKVETERKAAEVRRKIEEAEAVRLAKSKMEEEQHKRDLEEAEKERKRLLLEEKEEALLREKIHQKAKEVMKTKQKGETEKNTAPVSQLDSTFTKPLPPKMSKGHNCTFTKPDSENSVYDLAELSSGESSDEDSGDEKNQKTASWAKRPRMLYISAMELDLNDVVPKFIRPLNSIDLRTIFPNKRSIKRTSSAKWDTPPRYSCLPKY